MLCDASGSLHVTVVCPDREKLETCISPTSLRIESTCMFQRPTVADARPLQHSSSHPVQSPIAPGWPLRHNSSPATEAVGEDAVMSSSIC